ncbi:hypothetical protein FRC12_005081 [Ceratobasidium sp. 428]|nr:hypothetical protein FRC12_005081 [Ceratobasidium sp. 428]
MGEEFDLPTDVFSMGVIFCEVIARKLADDNVFKRSAPHWAIDADEVRARASPGCPPALIDLALDCCATSQQARPTMREVLVRLRAIELAVLEQAGDAHVGSVKFFTAGSRKRPSLAPRIPSFGMGVGSEIRGSKVNGSEKKEAVPGDEAELNEAVRKLENISISRGLLQIQPPEHGLTPASEKSRWESPRWNGDSMYYTQRSEDFGYIPSEPGSDSTSPLLENPPNTESTTDSAPQPSRFTNYSETVIRLHGANLATATPSVATAIPESGNSTAQASAIIQSAQPDTSSVLTVRASPVVTAPPMPGGPPPALNDARGSAMSIDQVSQAPKVDNGPGSRMSIDTYHTASSRVMPGGLPFTNSVAMGSIAGATEGSTMTTGDPLAGETHSLIHRFTLIKPGSARKGSISASPSVVNGGGTSPPPDQTPGWSPFEFFFSSGLGAKCDLCGKRLGWGWKPVFECDDCGMRTHVRCAESAPMDCGLRGPRHASPPPLAPRSPTSPKMKIGARRRSGENV